jgi:hypothetical protein
MSPRQRQQQREAHKRKRKFKRRTQFKKFSQNRKPGQAHTRLSFCESNAISESKYFDLKRKGKGPREIELDARIIITPEAEADWRAEREAETMAERHRPAAPVGASGRTGDMETKPPAQIQQRELPRPRHPAAAGCRRRSPG